MGQVEKLIALLEDADYATRHVKPGFKNMYVVQHLVQNGVWVETEREKEKNVSASEKDAEGMHSLVLRAPCKLGDSAFVLYFNEESGVTEIDPFEVTEISDKRIWLSGDKDLYYWHSEIGQEVFLSREDAASYATEHGMKLAQPDLDAQIMGAEEKKVSPARESSGRDFWER